MYHHSDMGSAPAWAQPYGHYHASLGSHVCFCNSTLQPNPQAAGTFLSKYSDSCFLFIKSRKLNLFFFFKMYSASEISEVYEDTQLFDKQEKSI